MDMNFLFLFIFFVNGNDFGNSIYNVYMNLRIQY